MRANPSCEVKRLMPAPFCLGCRLWWCRYQGSESLKLLPGHHDQWVWHLEQARQAMRPIRHVIAFTGHGAVDFPYPRCIECGQVDTNHVVTMVQRDSFQAALYQFP